MFILAERSSCFWTEHLTNRNMSRLQIIVTTTFKIKSEIKLNGMRSAFNGTPQYHCLLLFSSFFQIEGQSQLKNRDTQFEKILWQFSPFDFYESNGI